MTSLRKQAQRRAVHWTAGVPEKPDKPKREPARTGCLKEGCPCREFAQVRIGWLAGGPAEVGGICECGHALAMHITKG